MYSSRRSKKRSKFFWPEIGLLLLGILGFNPSLLFNVVGVNTQPSTGNVRPVPSQQSYNQQPGYSNPMVAWVVPAIQSAAQSLGGMPASATSQGQLPYVQPNYPAPYPSTTSYAPSQQSFYGDYANSQFQANNPYQYSPYGSAQWPSSSSNYYPVATASNNLGQGTSSRVPPVDYRSPSPSYPSQPVGNVPFPSTSVATPNGNATYGNAYGANVRKEGTIQNESRGMSQQYPTQFQAASMPPQYPYPDQTAINAYSYPAAQSSPYLAGQNAGQASSQYYWGAVDPRANNTRIGMQGSWVPNIPSTNSALSNPPASRFGRY